MELTHFDESGKAIMVDVTEKQDTEREAVAVGKSRSARQCTMQWSRAPWERVTCWE